MAKPRINAGFRRETEARLRRIARVAEVFVDGDAFKAFPRNPEQNAGDEYSVHDDKFITVKQQLFKLKRVEVGDIGVVTWRRFGDGEADQCLPVDNHPLKATKGNHPISKAMAEAFAGGTAVQELEWRGCPLLSVCAPIRDSLDDVVGVVEIFASLIPEQLKVDALDY